MKWTRVIVYALLIVLAILFLVPLGVVIANSLRSNQEIAASSLIALFAAIALPFTPLGTWFGFVAPPPIMMAGIALLVVVYLACAELLKPFAIRTGPTG